VWEGWHREVSPYPDPCPIKDIQQPVKLNMGSMLSSEQ